MSIEKQQEEQAADTPVELGKFFYIAVVVVFVAMLVLYFTNFGDTLLKDRAHWGTFGDFFGGTLNPLISFCTLIVAVKVWGLQKQELAETREAIKDQTFDQFFMSVLASHRAMSEQVWTANPNNQNTQLTGKGAIDEHLKKIHDYDDIFASMLNSARGNKITGFPDDLGDSEINQKLNQELKDTFNVWKFPTDWPLQRIAYFCVQYYKKNLVITQSFEVAYGGLNSLENIFGHIFRSTYQILKLIDEQFPKPQDKKKAQRYVNLLRAHMSESEFVFFALSAVTKEGKKSWARSVRLNFFQDRLQNSDWTKSLSTVFEASVVNIKEANEILKEKNAD